jgi:hypothetical protein
VLGRNCHTNIKRWGVGAQAKYKRAELYRFWAGTENEQEFCQGVILATVDQKVLTLYHELG